MNSDFMKDAIVFDAAFESLRKDREGEVKITFTVPLSAEHIARKVPIQTAFKLAILYENHVEDNIMRDNTDGCDNELREIS